MFSSQIDKLTEMLLTQKIINRRNTVAFNNFMRQQLNNAKNNYQNIIDDTPIAKSTKPKQTLETVKDSDGTITTIEYGQIPYVFVQSETVLKPDGSRVYTNYYPSCEKKPAKQVQYSAQSMVTKTIYFDIKGNIKSEEKQFKYPDGSGVEEKFEVAYNRRTKKFFNKNNITTAVESYVGDKLVFKLECDTNGNIKRQSNFYNTNDNSKLSKEIIYHNSNNYTVKEYTYEGKLYHSKTVC